MKIWHDDLGLQDDQYEIEVMWLPPNLKMPSVVSRVSRGDVAAAMSMSHAESVFRDWYAIVRDLLLAGF